MLLLLLLSQVHGNCTTVQAVVDLIVSVVDPFAPVDSALQADFDLLQILLACGASPRPAVASRRFQSTQIDDDDDEEGTGQLTMPPILRLLDCIQEALSKIKDENREIKDVSLSSLLPPIVCIWLEACQCLQDHDEADRRFAMRQAPPLLTSEDVSRYWHNAARRGQLVLMQALYHYLPTIFDVNAVNRQGMTALHFAARSGQTHVVAYLVSLPQIHLTCVDHRGHSVLDAALVNGHMNVVELLRRASSQKKC